MELYHLYHYLWLTLTWDVFKLNLFCGTRKRQVRLTLTWDVFKYINHSRRGSVKARLTLTWDVFKWKKIILIH